MCELFGVNANKEVNVNFTWRGFVRKGEFNPHGWGIGWYLADANEKRSASLIKQPIPAYRAKIALALPELGIQSRVIISHVRYTISEVSYLNTHPFVRRIRSIGQYDEWIFAHNGVLRGVEDLPQRFEPLGTTDSEAAFCYIMENLEGTGTIKALFTKLYRLLDELSDYGTLNVLMSNGRYLFAYSHYPSKGMWLLERHPPHRGRARLLDKDFEVSLGDMKARDEYACLVATRPLTDENWERLEKKTLYVFRDGALLLKVGRRIEPMLDAEAIEVLQAVLEGEDVELDETARRLIDLRLLKVNRNRVVINDHREAVVRLLLDEGDN